nr:hypothetical protein [Chlamydia abortus]
MLRTISREQILDLLTKLRARIPHIYIRYSFVSYFWIPRRTGEEFQELVDFVGEGWIDNLGIFSYSQEKGSLATEMSNQIPQSIKSKRLKILSQIQKKNIEKHNKQFVGKNYGSCY